jgi:hypothetical protein
MLGSQFGRVESGLERRENGHSGLQADAQLKPAH